MPVIYFQCTISTICNISLPTIMTTIYPKAAPYPPRFGWHFSDSSADCGKLTFGKLNSPSSCSSEKRTGNPTNRQSHKPGSSLSSMVTIPRSANKPILLGHTSCASGGGSLFHQRVQINCISFFYYYHLHPANIPSCRLIRV